MLSLKQRFGSIAIIRPRLRMLIVLQRFCGARVRGVVWLRRPCLPLATDVGGSARVSLPMPSAMVAAIILSIAMNAIIGRRLAPTVLADALVWTRALAHPTNCHWLPVLCLSHVLGVAMVAVVSVWLVVIVVVIGLAGTWWKKQL